MNRHAIRQSVVTVLTNAQTLAGFSVYSTRTYPLQTGQMPALMVYLNDEVKRSLAISGTEPQFRTTLTVTIQGIVEASDTLTIEDQLDTLIDNVTDALLTNPQFVSQFVHIGDITTKFQWHDSEKLDYAEASIQLDLVYDEVYQPVIETVFTGGSLHIDVAGKAGASSGVDIHGDYTPQVFPYPVQPAPRTDGPDGRIEIDGTIDLDT